jgi:hypothetical protein
MMRFRVGPAWALALAGIFAVAISPDAASAQRRVRITSVEITPADAAIQVGRPQVFFCTAFDAANNPIPTATCAFTSSNQRAATVDTNGIATGVGVGITIITARTGTGTTAKSATATLSVVGAAPPPVQLQGDTAAPRPRPVVSRPAGPGYAAFDRQPEGSGPAEGVVIQPARMTLVRGESKQLDYRAVRTDGENAERIPINFSIVTGGERLITVDSVGFIRALGEAGSAIVRADFPNNARIQARQVAVVVRGDSVSFQRTEFWLPPGSVDTLRIVVPAQDRTLIMSGDFNFSSSDETKVRVSPLRPIITTVTPGVARITGESSFFTVSAEVHVHRPVVQIRATPADSALTIAMFTTQAFTVSPLAGDSTPVTEAPLRWTTLPDSAIARFDTAAKTLRGIRFGETRLAVEAPFGRDSVIRRSWRIRVVAGGLSASRTRVGLGVGERFPVAVQLLDDRRQSIGPATGLTWTSSDSSVARFVDGHVRGLGVGRARLTGRTPWDSMVSVDVFVAGQLLVSAKRGGLWDLYGMSADSVPRFDRLTSDSIVELGPTFSPDLTRIAYVAAPPGRPTNLELFVANADGSEPRCLTNDSAMVGFPVFVRPAGERIVFQSSRGGRPQLYEVALDGSGRRQLNAGENPNTAPDMSPDGAKLVFVSLRQAPGAPRNYDIWEMNRDGTGEHRLTTSRQNEDSPQYSANGRSVYFLRDEGGSPKTKRVYRQSLTDTTAAQPITPVGMFVSAFSVRADDSLLVLTRLESVRGQGDVPSIVLFNPVTNAAVTVRVGAGDLLAGPVFRPATPQPR